MSLSNSSGSGKATIERVVRDERVDILCRVLRCLAQGPKGILRGSRPPAVPTPLPQTRIKNVIRLSEMPSGFP